MTAHGVIETGIPGRRTDYLFRVTLKAFIVNERNEVLVVKESGRDRWDLPGGGMDHGESIYDALKRELYEEVSLQGDFTYGVIDVEDAKLLPDSKLMQMRIVLWVRPENMVFAPGEDGDEVAFLNIKTFRDDVYKFENLAAYLDKAGRLSVGR